VNGNDDKALELLGAQMDIARDILLLKHKIINTILKNGRLPLCNEVIDNQPMLDLNRQALLFGFVGLDEMVTFHTQNHLHEDRSAMEFGSKILRFIVDRTLQYTKTFNKFFTVWEEPAEFAAHRFALLDLTHYPSNAKSIINGNIDTESVYYTPSAHANYAIPIPMDKKSEIHANTASIIQNNSNLPIWLDDSAQNEDVETLKTQTLQFLNKGINSFSYNFDFYSCPLCSWFKKKSPETSQNCKHIIKRISKITNYYAPLELWNPGKKQEFEERKRISL
jgi:ribonucleoside-triphosphate reductase